jgi:sulfur carrier protein ThiS
MNSPRATPRADQSAATEEPAEQEDRFLADGDRVELVGAVAGG